MPFGLINAPATLEEHVEHLRLFLGLLKKEKLTTQKEVVDESGDVRTLLMDKSHKSKYFVYPGADKMYYDLRD
ncbi:hypothetical protein Tco_1088866, partial [Tanacetum coccineum]